MKSAGGGSSAHHAMLQRDSKDPWQMVLLEVKSDVDPFYSHPIYDDDELIGIVTSGGFGHRVQKNLALALLRKPISTDRISVGILGRRYAAKRLSRVPFDPENIRLKS